MRRLLALAALMLTTLAGGTALPASLSNAAGEVIRKVAADRFTEAAKRHVSEAQNLRPGDDLKVVLPRLFAGHIWKRQLDDQPDGCLKFVKDDQFYESDNVRPGEVSYVAYIFHAEAKGRVKLEFRHLRPREKFDAEGPSFVLELNIAP